jgi:hypothetical protein
MQVLETLALMIGGYVLLLFAGSMVYFAIKRLLRR